MRLAKFYMLDVLRSCRAREVMARAAGLYEDAVMWQQRGDWTEGQLEILQ